MLFLYEIEPLYSVWLIVTMLNVGINRILQKTFKMRLPAIIIYGVEVNHDETVSRMALSVRYLLITIYLSEVSGCHIMETMLDKKKFSVVQVEGVSILD